MSQTNIERFNEVTAKILATLYGSFPEPQYLDPNALGLSSEIPSTNQLGEQIYSDDWREKNNFVRWTAVWLANEGYLSARTGSFNDRYTLSSAGFKSMKQIDTPEIGSPTLGEKIKKASSDGATAVTSKLVDQFLTVGATVLAKSFTGI